MTLVRNQRSNVVLRSPSGQRLVRPGALGSPGPKGDPGAGGDVIGLFTDGHSLTIPTGTDLVRTSGYSTVGIGGADYIADAVVDSAWVAAHPGGGFVSANSRGFRLIGEAGAVTPFMFGAIDCTGTPKGASETLTDCSDALDAMWSFVHYMANTRNIMIRMDCSGCLGLGLTSTWIIDTGDDNAIWNRRTFTIIPGRFVAMSQMVHLISIRNGNFEVIGLWELWGGTDTQLNAGDYGARLIENGLHAYNNAGSRMGDITCQGAKRWAVFYDQGTSTHIPCQWGKVIAVQCGCRDTDSVKFAGTYTGTWLNHPTDNSSGAQRHRLVLPLPTSIDPNIVRVGDMLDLGTSGSGYASGEFPVIVKGIASTAAHSVTVDVWPYAPVESGGHFLGMFGGGVDMYGGNLANNTFELIETYSCGVGVRYATLFSPKISSLLTESTLCSVQLGFEGGESMQGISVEHFHFESVYWSIIDYAVCFGATFGVASAQPGFEFMRRLVSHAITGSTWVDAGVTELLGVTINVDGEPVHMRGTPTKSRDMGGLTSHGGIGLGNSTDNRKFDSIYTPSGFSIGLIAEKELANKSVKDRVVRYHIYGDGPGGAPTSRIDIAPAYYQPEVTVNGGSVVNIDPTQPGELHVTGVYEPPSDNGPNGNWRISWSRSTSDVSVTSTDTFTGLEALPIDPLTVLTDFYCEMGRSATYQDTGTVTPAAAIDDPIGRISDLNGTNHLTQGTVGNKLALKKVGPLTFAQSGADDWLQTPSFSRAQPFTLAAAIIADTSLAANSTILTASGSAMGLQVQSNQWRLITGSGFLVDGRDKRGHTLIAVFNGASSMLYVDGQLVGTGDAGTGGIAGGLHLFVGASESSDFLTGAFFAGGCGPGDLSSSVPGLHAYLAALMGSE